ncbi:MAG: signal recognition particle subunit [Thelocarpon superellum]|nr:MAG: signal recognition particle subunit [Thelocarpon superellum]
MSRHVRIEEVSDSDSAEDSDPMDMDPADFDPAKMARPAGNPSVMNPSNIPSAYAQEPNYTSTADVEKYRNFQCVYPLYFDRTRSRAQGRRVGKELAVDSPLARDIVDAVGSLGLQALFEPGKMHPKDWSNPGRVKVRVKVGGDPVTPRVHNKHHLYTLIAAHLRAHPTTDASARRMLIRGLPPPDPNKPLPAPAVPRGWKINAILPLHSPALTGGGVSEDMMKEMLAGMGQGLGGMGMPGLPSGMGAGMPGMGGPGPAQGQIEDGGRGSKKTKKDKKKARA